MTDHITAYADHLDREPEHECSDCGHTWLPPGVCDGGSAPECCREVFE